MTDKAITLLDGAFGTGLWNKAQSRKPVWQYNIECPQIVAELTEEYIQAGAQIVQCNTFGGNRHSVSRTDYTVEAVMAEGVRIARETANGRAKVAMSVGPLSVLMEPYGDLEEDECREIFDEQISAGMKENPDIITFETFMDADMLRVAVEAAAKYDKPIFCTMTFSEVGKTIMGHSVEYFIEAMDGLPVSAVGINCSLGPDKAVPVIAQFREFTDLPLIFKPNAGKPVVENGVEKMQYDIDTFINDSLPALDHDVTYIGGCCGSNPDYIRALKARLNL